VSPFSPRRALLALAPRRAALLLPQAGAQQAAAPSLEIALDTARPDELVAALAAVHASLQARPVDVVLADALVKLFVVRPARGLAGMAELRAMVAARFEDLFGFDAAGWRIEADWRSHRPFLACAAPLPLLGAIDSALPRRASVAPLFVHCLGAAALPAGTVWCAARTHCWVTAACWHDGVVEHVRSVALPPAHSLLAWLAEEALLVDRPLHTLVLAAADGSAVQTSDFALRRLDPLPPALHLLDRMASAEATA
jgi:hypothetical protein